MIIKGFTILLSWLLKPYFTINFLFMFLLDKLYFGLDV